MTPSDLLILVIARAGYEAFHAGRYPTLETVWILNGGVERRTGLYFCCGWLP